MWSESERNRTCDQTQASLITCDLLPLNPEFKFTVHTSYHITSLHAGLLITIMFPGIEIDLTMKTASSSDSISLETSQLHLCISLTVSSTVEALWHIAAEVMGG